MESYDPFVNVRHIHKLHRLHVLHILIGKRGKRRDVNKGKKRGGKRL